MTKTRKNNHSCEATFCAIDRWYQSEFEKLGWMILAKHKGMWDKIRTYQNTLHHLKDCIEHKIKETKDFDKKNDLNIMCDNVIILLEHVKKDFD